MSRIAVNFGVGAAQLLSVILLLLFFRYALPGADFSDRHIVGASTPFLIWIPPLAVYAFAMRTRFTGWPYAWRVLAAVVGSIGIVIAYEISLQVLSRWQLEQTLSRIAQCHHNLGQICVGMMPVDPPPPPNHWQWAVAGFAIAMLAFYLILHLLSRRAVPTTGVNREIGEPAP